MAAFSDFDFSEYEQQAECETHGPYTQKCRVIMGRTIKDRCPVCDRIRDEEEAKKKAIKDAQEKQRQIEGRMERAGIPLRFRGKSFDNFVADTEPKKAALKKCQQFADNFADHYEGGTTVVLSGSPGTGKSHLALAIAQALMHSTSVMYLNTLDAVRMVRDTWRRDSEKSESQVLDILGGIGLLIIDEVGVQYGTEGEQVIMFDIINRRYRDMMPTILLTNLDKAGFAEYLGERSFDRLREQGMWIAFAWESYRVKKGA